MVRHTFSVMIISPLPALVVDRDERRIAVHQVLAVIILDARNRWHVGKFTGFPCGCDLLACGAVLLLFVAFVDAHFPSGSQGPISSRRSKSRHRGLHTLAAAVVAPHLVTTLFSCDPALQNEFRCPCRCISHSHTTNLGY